MSARDKFLALLRDEILQMDLSELDFGLYRILNYKRAEIARFLETDLPAEIAARLAALPGAPGEDEEARIYNALTAFFARYFVDADFMPRARRGKHAAYSVPYRGEDTHFHWASKGSHYIKSGERFAAYAYVEPAGRRIRFVVAAADVQKDNAKGDKRLYVPASGGEVDGEWRIAFAWRPLDKDESQRYGGKFKGGAAASDEEADAGDNANESDTGAPTAAGRDAQTRLLNAWLAGDDFKAVRLPKDIDRDLLAKHAHRYVKGQGSDFFVHPRLAEFLTDELDYYLKNEFVNLWDLPDGEALLREREKCKVVGHLARAIIRLLAAVEDVQAILFEKRKFVLAAHYLAQTSWLLREGGAAGRALVDEAAQNAAQVAEWRRWVGDAQASGKTLLERHPHLPIHTAHFDDDFQWRLLACFPDLQAALGGALIHGDNYAALRTLEPSYRQGVKCIHIDPPYNTATSGFFYKNDLPHASWLSMMLGRLGCAKPLLCAQGNLLCHIDEHEYERLHALCAELDLADAGTIIWDKRNPMTGGAGIATQHEYILWRTTEEGRLYQSNQTIQTLLDKAAEILARHGGDSATAQSEFSAWIDANETLSGGEKAYRFLDEKGRVYQSVSLRAPEYRHEEKFHQPLIHPVTGKPCPVPPNGFSRTPENLAEMMSPHRDEILFGPDETTQPRQKLILKPSTRRPVTSVVQDAKKGKANLDALGLAFPYCHPVSLYENLTGSAMESNDYCLDFFAGSGTTGHAVINLNREDGGRRKFILVEQGEYFDTVTLPRIAKVMTCPDWKDGQPKVGAGVTAVDAHEHWSRRTLPLVQVLRLERYEDSLDALELPADRDARLAGQSGFAALDTVLRYLNDAAAEGTTLRLSTPKLSRPFGYRLPVTHQGRYGEATVDLVHTGFLLAGLHPLRLRRLERDSRPVVLAEVRPHRLPERIELVFWRDVDESLPPAALSEAAQAEYAWLAATVREVFDRPLADYACIWHNRDLLLLGGESGRSIDAVLADRMWERA